MKPFGLTNAHDPKVKPYAVVQLRQDNALGTLFNIVGFQTKLKYGEQGRIFRMIPGLEQAEFARLGGMHRNTYLNSPRLLDARLRLKAAPRLRFAGQITGCEGYVESAAIGLIAGRFAAAERLGRDLEPPPPTTAIGALLNHITGGHIESIDAGPRSFQPMNVNFGLFPPIAEPRVDGDGKRLRGPERGLARKRALSARSEISMRGSRTAGRETAQFARLRLLAAGRGVARVPKPRSFEIHPAMDSPSSMADDARRLAWEVCAHGRRGLAHKPWARANMKRRCATTASMLTSCPT